MPATRLNSERFRNFGPSQNCLKLGHSGLITDSTKKTRPPTEAASERYSNDLGGPLSSPSNCRPSNNRGPRAHENCTFHSGPISMSPHERPRGTLTDIRRWSECASKRGRHRQYLPKRSPLRKPRCPRLLPRRQGICLVLSSSILRLCFRT